MGQTFLSSPNHRAHSFLSHLVRGWLDQVNSCVHLAQFMVAATAIHDDFHTIQGQVNVTTATMLNDGQAQCISNQDQQPYTVHTICHH